MTEEWRTSTLPYYEVSSLGRIRSRNGVLSGWTDRHGYKLIKARVGRGRKHFRIHRLVLAAFTEDHPDLQVRHLNGDTADNRLENLAWGTASDNAFDRVTHGTHHNTRKSTCPQGHPYTPDNTYIVHGSGRQCVICTKARARATEQRSKAA